VITDDIRAKLDAGTAVLWCAHWEFDLSRECSRLSCRTAVGWSESRRMRWDLVQLIGQRTQPYRPCRGLPEVYVWPAPEVILSDPGAWSEVAALGEPVGVHLIEGQAKRV
jgi:hypothetical protein